MSYTKLISFDRPLAAAVLPGRAGRVYSDSELAAREEKAFHRGVDAARQKVDQQVVELRSDMQRLGDEVFQKLTALEPALVAQLRDALPALALEISRRLIAGFEPPADVIARLCEEALQQLFPERQNLELIVPPRAAALLAELNPSWLDRYPGLRICPEPALAPGDCQVRSRFGLIDARLQSKLATLEHNLVQA